MHAAPESWLKYTIPKFVKACLISSLLTYGHKKKKEEKRGPQQSVVDPIMHGMACTYIKEISQMESSAPLKYV